MGTTIMRKDDAAVCEGKVNENIANVHYWIYSPGNGAEMWEKFYRDNVMAIAREYMGDLGSYASKKEMQQYMQKHAGTTEEQSCKNMALETWQFVHELKLGDVIFVKSGKHKILGRGIVLSEYYYDENYDDVYRNLRKVKWTHKGEWDHPGNAITKPLTDITPYPEYVNKLTKMFGDELEACVVEEAIAENVYTEEDFLDEVYMSRDKYEVLKNLLPRKKNMIIQGAPGVGKTFMSNRLAYSMMGVKDPDRIMMVQFHQSYSYEDFIMGFQPASTGFELKKGPFYDFCIKAELDPENAYFFIIDEINRGNISKIFGELLMLIENDKRGTSLHLIYSNEAFSVPENLYIIGMMNTADRSLALMDYALRRRFGFFELSPAFDTEGFRRYQQGKNNKKFNELITTIEKLNQAIEDDESLGRGFCIGHSYFCTEREIDDTWLNSVVTYEIMPLLDEYWFDEPHKVQAWKHRLYEAIR